MLNKRTVNLLEKTDATFEQFKNKYLDDYDLSLNDLREHRINILIEKTEQQFNRSKMEARIQDLIQENEETRLLNYDYQATINSITSKNRNLTTENNILREQLKKSIYCDKTSNKRKIDDEKTISNKRSTDSSTSPDSSNVNNESIDLQKKKDVTILSLRQHNTKLLREKEAYQMKLDKFKDLKIELNKLKLDNEEILNNRKNELIKDPRILRLINSDQEKKIHELIEIKNRLELRLHEKEEKIEEIDLNKIKKERTLSPVKESVNIQSTNSHSTENPFEDKLNQLEKDNKRLADSNKILEDSLKKKEAASNKLKEDKEKIIDDFNKLRSKFSEANLVIEKLKIEETKDKEKIKDLENKFEKEITNLKNEFEENKKQYLKDQELKNEKVQNLIKNQYDQQINSLKMQYQNEIINLKNEFEENRKQYLKDQELKNEKVQNSVKNQYDQQLMTLKMQYQKELTNLKVELDKKQIIENSNSNEMIEDIKKQLELKINENDQNKELYYRAIQDLQNRDNLINKLKKENIDLTKNCLLYQENNLLLREKMDRMSEPVCYMPNLSPSYLSSPSPNHNRIFVGNLANQESNQNSNQIFTRQPINLLAQSILQTGAQQMNSTRSFTNLQQMTNLVQQISNNQQQMTNIVQQQFPNNQQQMSNINQQTLNNQQMSNINQQTLNNQQMSNSNQQTLNNQQKNINKPKNSQPPSYDTVNVPISNQQTKSNQNVTKKQ